MLNQKKITNESYEKEKLSIEKWASKNKKSIEDKKNKYLMLYGNLNEFSTILKDKQPKPRRIRKKQSLSDSEIKLSRDVSQSELSQRHERRNSSFLSSEGRNHLLDDQRIQILSTDKQKSVDKLDYSKNGETIQNRLSKLEIFNDKDKTFSSKGPVMIKNDVQEQSDINDSIHEADSQFDSKKDIISQGKNIKENSLKDYLQTKIGETKHRNKSQKIIKNPSAEFNELVGFPSDDEDAQKQKNDIIDGISSDSHEAQSDTKSENKDNERNHKPIDTEEEAVPSHNPKVDEWTGFPSLSERTNIQEKDKQQTNLLETNSKEDNLSDDGRDKLDNAVDELFEESSIVGKDMLGFSDRSQMEFTAREEKKDDLMQDNPSPFSEKDMENNKSLHASREIEEDSQPQLPTDSLDVPGIDKIETIKESEDTEDSNQLIFNNIDQKVQSLLADSPISKQQPSISDIMNDDLTGASQPPPNRRSRTEDDLPGSSNPKKTNSEKADMLTEELMFYLSMEMRNSLFPQRVNPTLLKQKTEKEIEQYEKRKEQESFSKESNPDSLPMSEPGQELEDEMPQHKMAIKTDAESTKEYLGILFSRVQGSEEDFITNLSSPLQRNPLEILMHLQNTQYELESYEQLPYHPSVLTVDIYLDIERTRKREQEEILKIEQEKAYEIHAKDKETKLKESESKVEEDKQMKSDNDKPVSLSMHSFSPSV